MAAPGGSECGRRGCLGQPVDDHLAPQPARDRAEAAGHQAAGGEHRGVRASGEAAPRRRHVRRAAGAQEGRARAHGLRGTRSGGRDRLDARRAPRCRGAGDRSACQRSVRGRTGVRACRERSERRSGLQRRGGRGGVRRLPA